ncbi:hypothetical protein EPO56_02255 [Patescibacteria group bacterium]|nr:MAG: hypothetical protein EPO56_02255 [Patescibacteria group bacterium]
MIKSPFSSVSLSQHGAFVLALALTIGVLVSLIVLFPAVRSLFEKWIPSSTKTEVVSDYIFSIYENETYEWYQFYQGTEVRSVDDSVQQPTSNIAHLSNGMEILINDEGLVWHNPKAKQKLTLIERQGLTPDIAAVAPDGSAAVLFNQATNEFDVFALYDGGASVSYLGSFGVPQLPTYFSGVGFVSPTLIALHTGRPNNFEMYSLENGVTFVSSIPYVSQKK